MKSQYVEKFNHDEDAQDYDEDVKNESDPIRAGYRELLSWVAAKSNESCAKRVLELGVGTGNLSLLLEGYEQLVCVDTSAKMIEIAKNKFQSPGSVEFKKADLLEFFDEVRAPFDSIVSTYAIHHLTEPEKKVFFTHLYQSLNPGSIAVLGDLMFENQEEASALFKRYRSQGNAELVEDILDEFFWDIDTSVLELQKIGFETSTQRFSDLSWGMYLNRN